jgi:PAS domain S-box-containing protein
MSKMAKQDDANERENKEVSNILPCLKWAETGEILDVDTRLVKKLNFKSQEKFKQAFPKISQFFRHPTWEDLKALIDEQQKLTNFLVFIEDSNPVFYGVATIYKENEYYRAFIGINLEDPNKDLVRHSPTGECVSTDNGKFLIVNEKLADIYGYKSVEDMLAEPDIARAVYYKAEDRKRLVEMVGDIKLQKQEKNINFQFIGRRKNGELVIISKDVRPRFHGDKIVFLYGYVTDISEDLDDIKNISPVFKCDLDFERIIYVNKSMSNYLGYTQRKLRTMNLAELFSDSTQLDCLKDLRERRERKDIGIVLRRKDGSRVEVLLTVSIITAENGQTKDDVYIRGSLGCQLSKPVETILIDELRTALAIRAHLLNTEVQEWSVSAAREISAEITIKHFSEGELSQLIQNIKLVCVNHKNQGDSKLKFLTNLNFSLEEKVRLDVINSLRFINHRSKLLENAFTITQLAVLDFSEQDAMQRIQEKLLLAIDKDGELLFPSWQFDINSPDKVIDQLPQVLLALDETPITQLSWLMVPHDAFDGRKPYEVLKTGTKEDKQRVVSEASGVGGW